MLSAAVVMGALRVNSLIYLEVIAIVTHRSVVSNQYPQHIICLINIKIGIRLLSARDMLYVYAWVVMIALCCAL